MDYGLFRRFEKIEGGATLPRTAHEGDLFVIECQPVEGNTRSTPISMHLKRSGFGEILRLIIPGCSAYFAPAHVDDLRQRLLSARPPVLVEHDVPQDILSFVFFEGEPARERTVNGFAIFTADNTVAALIARLH